MSKHSDARLLVEVLAVGGGTLQLENVTNLQVRLEDGSWMGIRPGHAPLIAATSDGDLKYSTGEEMQAVHVKAGILSIADNIVSILTTH